MRAGVTVVGGVAASRKNMPGAFGCAECGSTHPEFVHMALELGAPLRITREAINRCRQPRARFRYPGLSDDRLPA